MPKQGMTGLTVKDEIAKLIRDRARANSLGINDYLSRLILGPSRNSQSQPFQTKFCL